MLDEKRYYYRCGISGDVPDFSPPKRPLNVPVITRQRLAVFGKTSVETTKVIYGEPILPTVVVVTKVRLRCVSGGEEIGSANGLSILDERNGC